MTSVIFAVSHDADVRSALQSALERRFGADYSVCVAEDAQEGLAELSNRNDAGEVVALLLASFRLGDDHGIEFLKHAHAIHPRARRIVVLDVGDVSAADDLSQALTRNQVDYYFGQPWASPEEEVYPVLGEALRGWAIENQPRHEKAVVIDVANGARGMELRGWFERNTAATTLLSVDDARATSLLVEHGLSANRLPVVVLYNGMAFVQPLETELASHMGGHLHPRRDDYDLLIIGAGAAGLAAAVYAGSEGLGALVIEHDTLGGQAGTSAKIRNYLGFPWGLRGPDFTYQAFRQADQLGAEIIIPVPAQSLRADGEQRIITLASGEEVAAPAVVIAGGVEYRRLGVPSVDALVGAGVFYGAAPSEARVMGGLDVCVLGAGNSAGQAAAQLAAAGARVTILVRGPSMESSMSDYLMKEIAASPSISVRLDTEVVNAGSGSRLDHVVLRNRQSGEETIMAADALFVFIGAKPCTAWLAGVIAMDHNGFVLTGSELTDSTPGSWPLERAPAWLETSMPGVFAAGDIRFGSIKRVAAAVGEGSTAAMFVREYLTSH